MKRRRKWFVGFAVLAGLASLAAWGKWYTSTPAYRARRLIDELHAFYTPPQPGLIEQWLQRFGLKSSRPQPRDPTIVKIELEALGEAAMPALIPAATDGHEVVRDYAIQQLGDFGPAARDAVPALVKVLRTARPYIRSKAVETLGKIGPDAAPAVPALIATLGAKHVHCLPSNAAETLGRIGPAAEPAVPALIAALKNEGLRVRALAAEALGRIGPPAAAALEPLLAALEDPESGIGPSAAVAVGRLGPIAETAVARLVETLGHKNADVRGYAVTALRAIGPPAADAAAGPLLRMLDDADNEPWHVRAYSAWALMAIRPGDREAVLAVAKATKDPDRLLGHSAVRALGKARAARTEAVAALEAALTDPNGDTRLYAAKSLTALRVSGQQ